MKRITGILLLLCLLLTLTLPALAVNEGETRVVVGADLTEDQILDIYGRFGLMRGSVPELTVTNAEERDYLEGIVSDSVIGTRSISCVYIRVLGEGRGLTVTTDNISWCTEDMYKSALMTAGIFDAQVQVSAPFSVSGTAALTGIYKAYEDITGVRLVEEAKETAADELVLTAELADLLENAVLDGSAAPIADLDLSDTEAVAAVSSADAVSIVNELKLILDETQKMSDDELRAQINAIAARYGYALDADMVDQLIGLCRSMEGLSIADLTDKVEQFKDGLETVRHYAETAKEYADTAVSFGQRVLNFFQSIIDFFAGLFSGR